MGDDKKAVELTEELLQKLVKDTLHHHRKSESFGDKIRKWWFLFMFLVGLAGAIISFYYKTNTHVDSRAVHFLDDARGERKQDFVRSEDLDEELEIQQEELKKVLEMQTMKQEVQMRQVLQEFKEDFRGFKRRTRSLQQDLESSDAER